MKIKTIIILILGSFLNAQASGVGITGSVTSRGTGNIKLETAGIKDIIFQKVILKPGGYTGWHTHPGPLVVVVRSGILTHYDRHCNVHTYKAGQAFIEPAGDLYVHQGVNNSNTDVVLDVTYILPASSPLRNNTPAPSCAIN